jgi:hypothetical protein
MNSITHFIDTDGSFKRKPLKPKKAKGKKPVPRKNKTPWGWTVGEREICDTKTSKGRQEYQDRVEAMIRRQNGRCKCGAMLVLYKFSHGMSQQYAVATFGHDIPRGRGGMNRDDRIWDKEGNPMNHAECWECNGAKGSKR